MYTGRILSKKRTDRHRSVLVFSNGLTRNTRTLNALYEGPLSKQIDYQERQQDQHTACIADGRLPRFLYLRSGGTQACGYLYYVRHKDQLCSLTYTREEQRRIEFIRPLPGKRKHEYGHEYRDRHRNDYSQICFYHACTVDICSFLQLIRNTLIILAENEYEQPVLKRKTGKRQYGQRPIRTKRLGNIFIASVAS